MSQIKMLQCKLQRGGRKNLTQKSQCSHHRCIFNLFGSSHLGFAKNISALDSWEMEQAIGKDICIIDIITKNISELSNSIIFIPEKSIQNNHLYHYQKQNNLGVLMDSFRILFIFDDIIRLEKGFLVEMLTRIPFTSLCSQWQCTTGISSKFRSFVPSEISGKCNTEAFQNWRQQHRVRILAKICTKCNINVGQKQKPDDGVTSRLQNLKISLHTSG